MFPRWNEPGWHARLPPFGQSVADLFEESAIMKKFLLAAALTAVCGVAAAQGYAGALIGMGKASLDCTSNCDESDTAFKAFAGYELAPGWSVEGSYFNLGTYKVNGIDVKFTGFGVGAAYRFDLMQDVKGVARLGLVHGKGKAAGVSESDTRAYVGLGAEYALGDGLTLTGGWDMASLPDGDKVNMFGIGAQVGF